MCSASFPKAILVKSKGNLCPFYIGLQVRHLFRKFQNSRWTRDSRFSEVSDNLITPVLYHFENLQKSKQKQFHVQCSVHKSYKTQKWTSLCIENFEENIDPSCIYLAVLIQCRFLYAQLSLFRSIETIWEWLIVFNYNFASFLVPCTC